MKIYKGEVDWNDSFQELADCWAESGYCEVNRSIDNFSWAPKKWKNSPWMKMFYNSREWIDNV